MNETHEALVLAGLVIAACLVIAWPQAALRAAVRIAAWIVSPWGDA